MTSRIESLQALRFLAASMVAWLHVEQAGGGPSIYGGALSHVGSFGVDVFFVLSGFIIARTATGKSPGEFLWRRLSRVVPIYWLLTVAYLAFSAGTDKFTWISLVATLTFYPEFGLPALNVGWTLCFEMLFYVATAWTLYRPRVFAPLALTAFALCWILRDWIGGPFRFFGNPLILEFLAGVLIARVNYRSRLAGATAAVAAAAILAFEAAHGIGQVNSLSLLVNGDLALQRVALFGAPAACLVFAALQAERKRGLLSHLGDASYSLYLIHPTVIAAMIALAPRMPSYVFAPLALGLSILASVVAYRWIERPLMAAFRGPAPLLATS
jgi:exopolysaccharide production protein ExoZ